MATSDQRLAHAEALAQSDVEAWPQTLADMVDVQQAFFRRQGFDPERARELARGSVSVYAEYWGGQRHYLPRPGKLRRALRDMDIYRRSGCEPVSALAREYGITESHAYEIIHRQRKIQSARQQDG